VLFVVLSVFLHVEKLAALFGWVIIKELRGMLPPAAED